MATSFVDGKHGGYIALMATDTFCSIAVRDRALDKFANIHLTPTQALRLAKRLETLVETEYPDLQRPLSDIAHDVLDDMRRLHPDDYQQFYYSAFPYILALLRVEGIEDMYGTETGRDLVTRVLCNLSNYRGAIARACKKEFKQALKEAK